MYGQIVCAFMRAVRPKDLLKKIINTGHLLANIYISPYLKWQVLNV